MVQNIKNVPRGAQWVLEDDEFRKVLTSLKS